MHFSFILTIVAALTVTVSASDADGRCPNLCNEVSCCTGQKCVPTFVQALVSISSLCPEFVHNTHQRDRIQSSIIVNLSELVVCHNSELQ
ncbi:uncharacterized protein HD556DRAFT_1315752 [Suillus plorans]|uniref:Hydrophobin n=1 Tax=Suillus plorans TaxID=116603 RepID=A0A9P7E378_9AGAM|nr:uncharacterized protein HD556DRAFT_1315752 [Suillus plorans]KAG1809798.1 hypothetical protein HD556DRAFT_1315752 [Suillus plorans]